MNWLDDKYYGATLPEWAAALGAAVALAFVLQYVRGLVVRRLRAQAAGGVTRIHGLFADVLAKTHFVFLLVVATYLALQYIELPPRVGRIVDRVVVLALLLQIALWGNRMIKWWLTGSATAARAVDASSATTVSVLGFIARVALWSVALLMILDNLGVDITALVASLGIGGIAVALAVQNILGDIFASLSIALDKPFVVGDFIIVDDDLGTVEYIGIKTTRVRSLSGEQVIFANADLLKSRIHNYKRMAERRILFGFGVVYETPLETLERIPGIVRAIVEAQPLTRFDRAHFKDYGESALNFEVVYYMKTPDYNVYMDTQQAINLALFRRFKEEEIRFAYPTQTLYLNATTPVRVEKAK